MANVIQISFNNDDIMSVNERDKFFDDYGLDTISENAKLIQALKSTSSYIHDFPMLEDVTLEYQSQYQQLSDIFNIAGRIQNILTAVQSLGGSASSISNIFTYEMWKSTDPLIINFKTILYAKSNPALDVWYLSALISSQSIITRINDGGKLRYKLPGLSLGGATAYQRQQQQKNSSTIETDDKTKKALEASEKSAQEAQTTEAGALGAGSSQNYQKLVAVNIPGVLFIDKAMIVSAKPTYSRQTARVGDKSFPIWCELDIQIKSISPAHSGFFTDMATNKTGTFSPPVIPSNTNSNSSNLTGG